MNCYDDEIERILIDEEDIKNRVKEVGAEITEDYTGKEVVLIAILRGSMIFLADLAREIDLPVVIDTMAVSSYYDSTETSGKVKINKDLESSVNGKHILIVEDILDTGNTIKFLLEILKFRGAKSVKVCSFLNKESRRTVEVPLNYHCFDIEDYFVVGYGLDFKQKYRNFPHIAILKPSIYE